MDKGTINVGKYSDGSGPALVVSFDTTAKYSPRSIGVEMTSNNWIGVDVEHVDELCRALRKAAKHVHATQN